MPIDGYNPNRPVEEAPWGGFLNQMPNHVFDAIMGIFELNTYED